jgi:uncharacterized protein YabE (DUF348 family)
MLVHMKKLVSKIASDRKWVIMSIALLAFLLSTVSVSAYHLTKSSVSLVVDGEEQLIKTHADTVAELLNDSGIDFNEHDFVEPGLNAKINADMKVTFKQSKHVQLTINGEKKDKWTISDTVKDLLAEENITIGEHDQLKPAEDTVIKDGTEVNYETAFKVILNDGGKEHELWTISMTVADFLNQHDINLNELDRIEPSENKPVTAETDSINITRVEKVTDVVEETVDYAVVKRKDSNLKKGSEKVLDSGKEGKVEKRFEVVLENGKEVSRKLIDSKVITESKDRIVAVGTKEIQRTVSRGAPSNYSKEIVVSSTAYTGNCPTCDGRGITATGFNLFANPDAKIIAVDPNVIPMGSKVWVEGYGYATAADKGLAIKGNKIDVFFSSRQQALNWGRRNVVIRVLN